MQDESNNTRPKPKTKFKMNKKTVLIIGIVAAIIIAIGALVKFDVINLTPAHVVTIESATELKTSGIEALKNNDEEMAQDLFEQAKAEYEELGDTNNVVDMEAQLYLLSH